MKIGMDIGTSTSSVCVDVDGEKHLIKCGTGSGATERHIPSAIYLKEDGTILIGQAAEQNKMRNPQCFAKGFKRDLGQKIPLRLGEKDYMPEELIAKLIVHLKKCAEKSEFTPDEMITEATICHPANFSQYKKDLLEKAAKGAGIDNVTLLDEPTAAAHYYHSKDKVETGEKLLIYDLGGGTFDISLMERTDHGVKLLTRPLGIDKCGGDDFNYAIYQYLEQDESIGFLQIKNSIPDENALRSFESNIEDSCIKAKELLSYDDKANIFMMYKSADITRAEFEAMIKEYVDETLDKVSEAIKNAGLEPSDIDKILLVGGSCRIPYIKNRLIELVGDKVVDDVDPDLAVVHGSTCESSDALTDAKTYFENGEYDKAYEIFSDLMEKGNAQAMFHIAKMYEKGLGVMQDDKEAAKWYRKAAEQRDTAAQCNLGVMYENGQGLAQDHKEAARWYEKAAEKGHADAQNKFGVLYRDGLGVVKDDNEAIKWYRRAAEQEHAGGQNNLGFMYSNGRGVSHDDEEAVKWYRKAAEQGHAGAQNNLGFMYSNGRGVTQDNKQAVKWYRKAAEQGDADAQYVLGICYKDGKGVVQNNTTALKWLRKSKKQGHLTAHSSITTIEKENKTNTSTTTSYPKRRRRPLRETHNKLYWFLVITGMILFFMFIGFISEFIN